MILKRECNDNSTLNAIVHVIATKFGKGKKRLDVITYILSEKIIILCKKYLHLLIKGAIVHIGICKRGGAF